MVTGSSGPFHSLQHLGLHYHLRHVPIPLRAVSPTVDFNHLMDRKRTGLPSLLHGHVLWPSCRCWVFFKLTWSVGAILNLLGIFTMSFCDCYWQLLLAQGFCTGLGCGLMFCPVLSLMSTYFVRYRSLAVGLAATGSATGGLIFPAVVERLLPRIGFPWTVRTLGFLTLAMLLLSFLLLKQRLPPQKSGPLIDWMAFREPIYLSPAACFSISGVFISPSFISVSSPVKSSG